MSTRTSAVAASERYFEDYVPGTVFESRTIRVEEADIIAFAKQFDPQYFHVDPERAKQSRFGGLVASGWHTSAIMMRLYVECYVSEVASLGSPGVDEVRYHRPVRPGDSLRLRVTVLEATPSRSKPDRGMVLSHVEVRNQRDEVVLSLRNMSILRRRNIS